MDVQTVHASKRKQDCVENDASHQNPNMEALNSKKQRLSREVFYPNSLIPTHCAEMLNGQETGELTVSNSKKEVHCHMSEPMEYTEEINGNTVGVNGNGAIDNSKLCPHGHINACTTYNVPCRYPRMYCHPGGIIEDRLQAYHGF